MTADNLGDRMKGYESVGTAPQAEHGLPICIRLDGRAFHSFTQGLNRPYDDRLSTIMRLVMRACAEETNAVLGYTQSDEISLVLYSSDAASQLYFDGRFQKIISMLAGVAAFEFNRQLPEWLPNKAHTRALFDCRAWTVPSLDEAANAILWRELDAVKNSISMLAEHYFSTKQLHGLGQTDRLAMLRAKNVEWEDYPTLFKRGQYVRRVTKRTKFTTDELDALPLKHAARTNPNLEIERQVFEDWHPPALLSVSNRVGALFRGEDPR